MSNEWQEETYGLLRAADIDQFAFVPDAGHDHLIKRSIALTIEEEGMGLLAGAKGDVLATVGDDPGVFGFGGAMGAAASMGLANHCVAEDKLEAEVGAIDADIVAASLHSLRGNKMLYNRGQDYTFRDGISLEMAESPGRGPDIEERLKAFAKN